MNIMYGMCECVMLTDGLVEGEKIKVEPITCLVHMDKQLEFLNRRKAFDVWKHL